MHQAKFLLNPLLVRVDRLRADEQTFADLRRRVPLGDKAQDVAFALCERIIAITLGLDRVLAAEALDQDA